jgi:hypothetical protein
MFSIVGFFILEWFSGATCSATKAVSIISGGQQIVNLLWRWNE